mmetsp:Transcript_76028/g.211267  ORF Transcript_76028/g.211267 Transcript_76028/m.211267 type:complete len:474 (-) Transcript_76028:247-1668(-)
MGSKLSTSRPASIAFASFAASKPLPMHWEMPWRIISESRVAKAFWSADFAVARSSSSASAARAGLSSDKHNSACSPTSMATRNSSTSRSPMARTRPARAVARLLTFASSVPKHAGVVSVTSKISSALRRSRLAEASSRQSGLAKAAPWELIDGHAAFGASGTAGLATAATGTVPWGARQEGRGAVAVTSTFLRVPSSAVTNAFPAGPSAAKMAPNSPARTPSAPTASVVGVDERNNFARSERSRFASSAAASSTATIAPAPSALAAMPTGVRRRWLWIPWSCSAMSESPTCRGPAWAVLDSGTKLLLPAGVPASSGVSFSMLPRVLACSGSSNGSSASRAPSSWEMDQHSAFRKARILPGDLGSSPPVPERSKPLQTSPWLMWARSEDIHWVLLFSESATSKRNIRPCAAPAKWLPTHRPPTGRSENLVGPSLPSRSASCSSASITQALAMKSTLPLQPSRPISSASSPEAHQ